MSQTPEMPVAIDPSLCVYCRVPLQFWEAEELRSGGSTGAGRMLLGQWGELGEHKVGVQLYVCPRCGTVVFRNPTSR
jgi:NAD-dependent dihydropyrimidine dehydrogenase PreA subunit